MQNITDLHILCDTNSNYYDTGCDC